MQPVKSRREKNIIKVIERCTDLWIIIVSIFSLLFTWFSDKKEMQLIGIIGGLCFSILFFYLGKEVIIAWVMEIVKIHKKEEKDFCGNWRIEIEYFDQANNINNRFGYLDITLSPSGLFIHGKKLTNTFTKEKTTEEWVSEYVKVIKSKDNITLAYAYRIHRPDDSEDEYSKVGHVVANKNKDGIFEGKFVDLLIPGDGENEDEVLRSGTVTLQRS